MEFTTDTDREGKNPYQPEGFGGEGMLQSRVFLLGKIPKVHMWHSHAKRWSNHCAGIYWTHKEFCP